MTETSWYTDEQLEEMLGDLESDLVERKETFKGDAPTKVREAVCAFANDLPKHGRPGVVFIGVTDSGELSGNPVTDELLRNLADIKTDGNIVPPPTLVVEKRHLSGADLAVVIAQPADIPPVRFKGRIYIRIGPRKGIASAQDERILNEKRRYGSRPFDVQPVAGAQISDLSLRQFEDEYLPSAVAPDVLSANERTLEQKLAATKMIAALDDPRPTVLGLLVLGVRTRDYLPGAYIQFLRVAGRDLASEIVDEQTIDGSVSEMIRRVEEKLAAHNRAAVDFTSDPKEHKAWLFPEAALQQLVRNAIMHRTYEAATNAPIRIVWYADRLEILSPGGPFGLVTPETFGRPGIVDYRNPGLAEALRVLGYVQRFGAGIATARRAMENNGNPAPTFQVESSHVLWTLRPPQ